MTEALAMIWNWSLDTALWLPAAPQGRIKCRDQISLCAVHVTNKVPFTFSSLCFNWFCFGFWRPNCYWANEPTFSPFFFQQLWSPWGCCTTHNDLKNMTQPLWLPRKTCFLFFGFTWKKFLRIPSQFSFAPNTLKLGVQTRVEPDPCWRKSASFL